ncbi:MAG: hypothetical protein R2799_16460 [Crocinitomicaceae bacterium]
MNLGKLKNSDSHWVSFSDIMTGLMVIFMFIAISYLLEVQRREKEINEIIENYKITQQKLYNELDDTFTERFKDYNLKVNPDLSIQITDANALFPVQFWDSEVKLTKSFIEFLDEFTPLFYSIVLKEEYIDDISEIRIEGHTAIQSAEKEFDKNYYQKMLILSQKRSNKVLETMMNSSFFNKLNDDYKAYLRYITTSNGLAFGKALDKDGNFKFLTGESININNSMRVEFRIVTNNQKVIDDWIKTSNE